MTYNYIKVIFFSLFFISVSSKIFAQSGKWLYAGESETGNRWYYNYDKNIYKEGKDYDMFWVKVVYNIKPVKETVPPYPADTIQFTILFYEFKCKENKIKTEDWTNYYRRIDGLGEEQWDWDSNDEIDKSWRIVKENSMEAKVIKIICK